MVLGGQFFNVSSRLYDVVAEVEVVGPRGSCQLPPLPSPLYALTATRVGRPWWPVAASIITTGPGLDILTNQQGVVEK